MKQTTRLVHEYSTDLPLLLYIRTCERGFDIRMAEQAKLYSDCQQSSI